jgi:hypothetical protein
MSQDTQRGDDSEQGEDDERFGPHWRYWQPLPQDLVLPVNQGDDPPSGADPRAGTQTDGPPAPVTVGAVDGVLPRHDTICNQHAVRLLLFDPVGSIRTVKPSRLQALLYCTVAMGGHGHADSHLHTISCRWPDEQSPSNLSWDKMPGPGWVWSCLIAERA